MKVVFVGKTQGKISSAFIAKLLTYKTEHQVSFYSKFEDFEEDMDKFLGGALVVPAYCEDEDLKHRKYYVEKIEPNIKKLSAVCKNIGNVFGLGFYGHDFLLDKNNDFYLCESFFKFDNIKWKRMNANITSKLPFEQPFSRSLDKALDSFFRQINHED